MQPDTVLVCPTTTPAWTPLFAQAKGLVTDIGGVAAHGSIVAREYGIPAVMGTGNATQRIADGQTVKVDGDAGTVTIGEGAEATRYVGPGGASGSGRGATAAKALVAALAVAVAAWWRRGRR
jgi:phosphoenolpyruvate synthase/pyruvate phosphate dikinase